MEVVGYECHDIGLALEALESGFWIDHMKVTCRTGEPLKLPIQRAHEIRANGFVWYDIVSMLSAQSSIVLSGIYGLT